MTSSGAWLEDLTWREAEARFAAGRPMILPIGAAAKEHGHHLPLKTDYLTARALGQRLIDRLDVVVAPVVGFGFYPAFANYAGSQHLEAGTFMAVIRELIGNAIDQGVRHIAIVNTGVSTEAPLNIAVAEIYRQRGVRVWCAHMRLFGRTADRLLDQPGGGHGDERETSIVLALEPRSVRMNDLVPGQDLQRDAPALASMSRPFRLHSGAVRDEEFTATGALGDPRQANAFKGERILAAMVEELDQGLRAAFPAAFTAPATG